MTTVELISKAREAKGDLEHPGIGLNARYLAILIGELANRLESATATVASLPGGGPRCQALPQ